MSARLDRGLYVITDCENLPHELLVRKTARILSAGITALQYRNKTAAYAERLVQAGELRALSRRYDTPFIVNDDIELAAAVDADGVHLGSGDPSLSEALSLLGTDAIIGVSCYDRLAEGLAAQKAGATYVAFGAFYPSVTKVPNAQANIGLLKEARSVLSIPIVAIGGINPGNAGVLLDAGADILAVVNSVFGAADPAGVVREFNALFA